MKNKDKYKTREERIEAFNAFCKSHLSCKVCPLFNKEDVSCKQRWLDVEIAGTLEEEITILIDKINNKITQCNNFLRDGFDQYIAGEKKAFTSVLVLLEKIMEKQNENR